jgi:hypothetical protein
VAQNLKNQHEQSRIAGIFRRVFPGHDLRGDLAFHHLFWRVIYICKALKQIFLNRLEKLPNLFLIASTNLSTKSAPLMATMTGRHEKI